MDCNVELLEHLYKDSSMGTQTLTDLLNVLNDKDNKIKDVIEDQLKGYERYKKEASKYLKKYKKEGKEYNMFAKMGAMMGVKMEMLKDNSDSRVADMLIKGFTMGIIEAEKKIKNYKDKVDSKNLDLMKEFLKFHEDNVEALKKFL